MDIKDINRLIDKVTEKGITDFEMEHEGFKLRICKKPPDVIRTEAPAPAPVVQTVQATVPEASGETLVELSAEEGEDDYTIITSPMVGTFYGAPSPGAKPYISIGDRVRKGQVCCIVEAMKIMNEIQSDVDGVVRRVHAKNEQPVEFGEPLFSIELV